jgi:heme-degrading monooxygenase HmoA
MIPCVPPGSYAVIFTSAKNPQLDEGYEAMASRMWELAAQQPGFLGVESVRNENGRGITVSYWESLESIQNWKRNAEHQVAQRKGRDVWYSDFQVQICKVERTYGK